MRIYKLVIPLQYRYLIAVEKYITADRRLAKLGTPYCWKAINIAKPTQNLCAAKSQTVVCI